MCDSCDHEQWIDEIDSLLDNVDYEFAMDTLCGIQDWVRKKGHITEKQIIAIENIRNNKRRGRKNG